MLRWDWLSLNGRDPDEKGRGLLKTGCGFCGEECQRDFLSANADGTEGGGGERSVCAD